MKKIIGKIDFAENKSVVGLAGTVDTLEVFKNNMFIAGLENKKEFEINATMDDQGPVSEYKILAEFPARDGQILTGSVVGSALSEKQSLFLDCGILNCPFNEVDFRYSVLSDLGGIAGSWKCPMVPCVQNKITHSAVIKNTEEFLADLSASRVLGPLAFSFIYSSLFAAEKTLDGHYIKF